MGLRLSVQRKRKKLILARQLFGDPLGDFYWGNVVEVSVVDDAAAVWASRKNINKPVIPENFAGQVRVASVDGLGERLVQAGHGGDRLTIQAF